MSKRTPGWHAEGGARYWYFNCGHFIDEAAYTSMKITPFCVRCAKQKIEVVDATCLGDMVKRKVVFTSAPSSAEGDRQWNVPGSTHPERLFAEWLNDQRMKNVSEVFHDIVSRYREALDSPVQPKGMPLVLRTETRLSLLRALDGCDKAGWMSDREIAEVKAALSQAPAPAHEPVACRYRRWILEGGEKQGKTPWYYCTQDPRPLKNENCAPLADFEWMYAAPAQAPAVVDDEPTFVAQLRDFMDGIGSSEDYADIRTGFALLGIPAPMIDDMLQRLVGVCPQPARTGHEIKNAALVKNLIQLAMNVRLGYLVFEKGDLLFIQYEHDDTDLRPRFRVRGDVQFKQR